MPSARLVVPGTGQEDVKCTAADCIHRRGKEFYSSMGSRSESPSTGATTTRHPISPEAQRPRSSGQRSRERCQNTSPRLPDAAPPDKMARGTATRREQSRVAPELAAKSIHSFPRSLIAMFSELFDDPENVRVTNRPVEIGGPKAPRAKNPKHATRFPYANRGTRLRRTQNPTTFPASFPATDSGEILAKRGSHGAHEKGHPLENQAKKHTKNYKKTT